MKVKKIISCMIVIFIFSSSAFAETNSIMKDYKQENNTEENSINSYEDAKLEDKLLTENTEEKASKTNDFNEQNNIIKNNEISSKLNIGRTQVDGIYKVAVGKDPKKAIEIGGGNEDNNAGTNIWEYGNASWQKFYFEYNNDGYYKITTMHTGKSLTVKDNNLTDGVQIVQTDYQGLNSQKWILRDTNKNGWVISLQSNPQLSISIENNFFNGAKMILSKTQDNDNQMFYLYNITSNEQYKANGNYKIVLGIDSTKAIGIEERSKNENVGVEIDKYGNKLIQKFNIEYIDGYYKITSEYSKKSLTVKNNNLAEGTEVVQADYQGLASQKWILRDNNKKGCVISLLSNPQLSITVGESISNGTKIIISKAEDKDNQTFNIVNVSIEQTRQTNGIYRVAIGVDPNKSIEVGGGNKNNNAGTNIWDYGNVEWQKFYFEYNEEGFYKITVMHTGKSLTVKDNNLTDGVQIVQADYQGLDSQKWILRDTLVNGWIISLESNPELSISVKGDIVNGAKVILSKTKDSDNQMLYLYNITSYVKTKEDGIYKIETVVDSNKIVGTLKTDQFNDKGINISENQNLLWQKFYFEYNEEGYYKITEMYTGKSLTVKDNNVVEGTEIVQDDYQGLDSQKWILRDNEEDKWIISLLNKPQLSITIERNISNDLKLIISKTENIDNQRFYLYNITDEERTMQDGIYKIAIGKNSNKVIEVGGGSKYNDATVDIWDFGDVDWQKFCFEYKEGYYKITAKHTGKSLTVRGNNLKEGVQIIQADYQDLTSQKWILRDSGKNGWVISLLSNPELSISVEGNIVNGERLILSKTKDNDNQMFYLFNITTDERTQEDGIYKLSVGKNPNKAIEVGGGSKYNNAPINIWDYGNAQWQKYYFEYKEGFYKITAMHTGKSLTVKDNNIVEGTEIVQEDYQGWDSQKWILRDSYKNGWIISLLNNPQLSISIEGNIANGSKMILSKTKDNDNQMFYLFNITTNERTSDNGIYKLAVGSDISKVIEVPGESKDNGTPLGIGNFRNTDWQKFYFEYKEGYYKITAGHTKKSLTVKDNNIVEGTEIVQEDYQGLDSQKWLLKDSKINGWIISPLSRPDLSITVENTIVNGSKLILESLQYNERQMFYCYKTFIGIDVDSNKYPGISEAINNLVTKHPNWQFDVLYTGIDFYTAVQGEYEYDNKKANLVDTNVYKGDWIAPNPYVSENWASASYKGIAYFMDPRNFLNDVDVFQFVDLADYYNSGATLDSIQYQVNGTFLSNFAEDIRISCEHQNVNPYYIIARLFQEQGKKGSITIYMDGGDGKLYFNPFNIGAVVGNDFNTALAKAKKEGWDTMQKGIEGGIKFIRQGYLDAHQNTLYLNKFDVNPNSPGGFYTHQYMQNLSAAYSEARIFRGAYEDTGTLDNTIKFIIPVYENMPENSLEKPIGSGTSIDQNFPAILDQGPKNVQIYNIQTTLKVRSGPGQKYDELERLPNGTILLSIERYENGWQKVITPSKTVGYCSGEYLKFIRDVSNCNDRVEISANGGVNVRIGPGQGYASLGIFKNGTKGIRILKDIYYEDGYIWDLVILDDGTKGFIASQYLKQI